MKTNLIEADKYRKKQKRYKIVKLIFFGLLFLLVILYAAFSLIYDNYSFTVTLDRNLYYENNVVVYDNKAYKTYRQKINVDTLEYFDNISGDWLPKDIDNYDGSHNGNNYIAYTYYVENMGKDIINYWTQINLDDSVKGLDEAIRIRVYIDGVPTTYAKPRYDGKAEEGTEKFYSKETIMLVPMIDFKPNDVHKYTVVIWLEGNDPDCNDSILGGELKFSIKINSDMGVKV